MKIREREHRVIEHHNRSTPKPKLSEVILDTIGGGIRHNLDDPVTARDGIPGVPSPTDDHREPASQPMTAYVPTNSRTTST